MVYSFIFITRFGEAIDCVDNTAQVGVNELVICCNRDAYRLLIYDGLKKSNFFFICRLLNPCGTYDFDCGGLGG